MDWSKETIYKLYNLTPTTHAIENMKAEIERLQLQLQSIKSSISDGTPVKSGGNTREERLVATIAEIDELRDRIKHESQWVTRMESALADLSAEDRQILDLCYINRRRFPIDEVCTYLCVEKTRAYEKRNAAVERLARRLYGAY